MAKQIYPSGFRERKTNFANKLKELKGQVKPGVETRIISLLDLAGESAQKLKAPLKAGDQQSLDVLDEFRDKINKIIDKEIEGINEAIKNSDQTKDDEQQKGEKARKEAREQLIKNKAIWEQLKQNAEETIRWFREDIAQPITSSGARLQEQEPGAQVILTLYRGYLAPPNYSAEWTDQHRNLPEGPWTVTITDSCKVLGLYAYHDYPGYYNDYPLPGTIGLRSANGNTYGPWKASRPAHEIKQFGFMADDHNVWAVLPDVIIPPGTYQLFDSDPGTRVFAVVVTSTPDSSPDLKPA